MIDPTPRIVRWSRAGIDIAIRYGTGDWPGLEAHCCSARPSSRWRRRILWRASVGSPEPADLADLPWLQEFGTNEASDWLRRRGVVKERAGGLTQVPGNLLLDGLRAGRAWR